VQKVRLVAGLIICVHFLDDRREGERMRNGGIDLDLCDGADKFGDERNFMSCSHGVKLEHLVFLNESFVPVLVAVVAVGVCLRIAWK